MFSEAPFRVVCVYRQDGGVAKVNVASSLGGGEEEELGKNSALIVSKRVTQHFSRRFSFFNDQENKSQRNNVNSSVDAVFTRKMNSNKLLRGGRGGGGIERYRKREEQACGNGKKPGNIRITIEQNVKSEKKLNMSAKKQTKKLFCVVKKETGRLKVSDRRKEINHKESRKVRRKR